jgi:hypothetical protein
MPALKMRAVARKRPLYGSGRYAFAWEERPIRFDNGELWRDSVIPAKLPQQLRTFRLGEDEGAKPTQDLPHEGCIGGETLNHVKHDVTNPTFRSPAF